MEIETNASLNLMNSHFSFGKIAPILPNQVEVGCMQCRQPEPLPKVSRMIIVIEASIIHIMHNISLPHLYKSCQRVQLIDHFSIYNVYVSKTSFKLLIDV